MKKKEEGYAFGQQVVGPLSEKEKEQRDIMVIRRFGTEDQEKELVEEYKQETKRLKGLRDDLIRTLVTMAEMLPHQKVQAYGTEWEVAFKYSCQRIYQIGERVAEIENNLRRYH